MPTLINIATFPDIAAPAAGKFPLYAKHMLALHERRYATIAAAREAGIRVYTGTDAGGSLAHGRVADEALELAAAGFTATAALGAATWDARRPRSIEVTASERPRRASGWPIGGAAACPGATWPPGRRSPASG